MERTLSAYTTEHINEYFSDVKTKGLTEHGFPRLTANIGILIAHGRRLDLTETFLEMMEFCCKTIPNVKASNDFSVREIVCCIREIEKAGIVDMAVIYRWKNYFAAINPLTCYNVYANDPADKVKNWALFTGVSEYFRQSMGLGDTAEFIDLQLASQFKWIDENGMYMDAAGDTHHPFVYDLVARGLFALLLTEGYRGVHYEVIDDCLRRSGLLTLKMQSPSGEIPFGGRSNQFMHNEAWLAAIFEFEAHRYAKEGNTELACEFKSAAKRAFDSIEYWLSLEPIRHIKNRFPTETHYGCEGYAYFNKYMITVASFLYAAYIMCDDSVPTVEAPDVKPAVFMTSYHFHKLFMKAGGYGLEFDLDGDPHYDASGLGRVHKAGAPSPLCMTHSCPAEPKIRLDIENPFALSLAPAVMMDGVLKSGADSDVSYEVVSTSSDDSSAYAEIACVFPGDIRVTSKYKVNSDGVSIDVSGDGETLFVVPAFCFDGEVCTQIEAAENTLSVTYRGFTCKYTASGKISETGRMTGSRSGHYKEFVVCGNDGIKINIEIIGSDK